MKPLLRLGLLLAFGWLASLPVHTWAATDTVTSTADDGSAGTLRAVLAAASAGDTIVFAPDVTGTITLQSSLTVASSVTITGPGAGTLAVSGNSAYTVFYVTGGTSADPVTITGLTIENGAGSEEGLDSGGGILVDNGGAITVADCDITGNTASELGGGAFIRNGAATLTNCSVSGNSAAEAGGIASSADGTMTLTGCSISENISSGSAGGVENNDTATLTACTFSSNSANPSGGTGGGFWNDGTATLTNCVFVNNSAAKGCGISNFETASLTNCTIAANYSPNNVDGVSGAGIYNAGALSLTNDILFDDNGSEIYNDTAFNSSLSASASYCDIADSLGSSGDGTTDDGNNKNDGPDYAGYPGDLALSLVSPCVGTGATQAEAPSGVTIPTTDINGAPRFSPPSIGAYAGYQLIVNSTADPDNNVGGNGTTLSLREAINQGNAVSDAVITFDPTVFASDQTITEALGSFTLSDPMDILAPAAGLNISAANTYGGFEINGGTSTSLVTIEGLTIENAGGTFGGIQIDGGGYLSLANCAVTDNLSNNSGGGMFVNNNGSATASDCQFTNNACYGAGGGVYNSGDLTMTNCVVASNQLDTVPFSGGNVGAGVVNTANATLINCTVTANGGIGTDSTIGIVNGADNPFSLTLINDIVYGNSGGDVDSGDGIASDAFCDIGVEVGVNAYGGAVSGVGGNITPPLDPMFVDSPTNLRLQINSPCFGAGATQADLPSGFTVPTTDITGAVRPSPPSIGAYDINAAAAAGIPTPVDTTTTLTSPTSPASYTTAQSIPLAATVSPSTATGSVTFTITPSSGSTVTETGTLSDGTATATVPTSTLAAGSYTVTASYGGDDSDNRSASSPALALTVTSPSLTTTTTTLTSPTSPASYTTAQSIPLAATVSPSTATGSVTFTITPSSGSTVTETGTLSDGTATATVPTSTLAAGSYTVTASYGGDDSDNPSASSPALALTVTSPSLTTTTTTLTSPTLPASYTTAQSIPLAATVSPSTATGSVTFTITPSSGSAVTETGTLSDGTATATVPASTLAAGSYTVTASYGGDDSDNPSASSPALALTVTSPAASVIATFNPGWQMVCFDETYGDFEDALNGATPPTYFTYNGSNYVPFNSLTEAAPTPGMAFWVNPSSGSTVSVYNTGSAVSTVHLPLSQGWNMIGDPFAGPNGFPLSDISVTSSQGNTVTGMRAANSAGLLYSTLYTWTTTNTTAYTIVNGLSDGATLSPLTGYWLYAFQTGETLTLRQTS